jgi:hypothetical protein
MGAVRIALKELIVTLPNKPGQVHTVANLLSTHGINMLAVAVIANGDTAEFHLVVDKAEDGERTLRDQNINVKTGEVLLLELLHSPGELARIAKLLADAKVNITLLYGSGAKGIEAQLVLGVDDLKKAKRALDMD